MLLQRVAARGCNGGLQHFQSFQLSYNSFAAFVLVEVTTFTLTVYFYLRILTSSNKFAESKCYFLGNLDLFLVVVLVMPVLRFLLKMETM